MFTITGPQLFNYSDLWFWMKMQVIPYYASSMPKKIIISIHLDFDLSKPNKPVKPLPWPTKHFTNNLNKC